MNRRGFFALLLGLFCVFSWPNAEAKADEFTDGARKFIRILADTVIINLTAPNLSPPERENKFRQLLQEKFDINGMGKWVLGRYWRRASRGEKLEYLKLFEDLIVATYSKRFSAYTDESLKIIKVASRGQAKAIVYSNIERGSQQKPVRVDWSVVFSDGRYKVTDIVVEGISMKQTQRSEFASVIRRNGGKVTGLLVALRAKMSGQENQQ